MSETNNTPEPTHDCAEIIAMKMYAIENGVRLYQNILRNWNNLSEAEKFLRKEAVKALPRILLTHTGDDLKAWLVAQIGTSSPWRSVLGYLSAAAVGAVVLWGASFFTSCAPVTPEQVQQIDAAHAIMHRVTGTGCTLCRPVTSKFK